MAIRLEASSMVKYLALLACCLTGGENCLNGILTTLWFVAALVGHGRLDTPNMNANSKIVPVQSDDAEMNAAMQTARDRFPGFWQEVSSDYKRVIPILSCVMVKAYFEDARGSSNDGEHMWVRDLRYDGKTITGVLADAPRRLLSVKAGQQVSFPLERLSDWLYVEDGTAFGAFTVQELRKRMSEEERQVHDNHYPFRFKR